MLSAHLRTSPYWRNVLFSVVGALVIGVGSTMVLRASESLRLTYGFIASAVVIVAVVGVMLKRRTDRSLPGNSAS